MTKYIHPEDTYARFKVFEAVGASFFLRLLLPLRKGRVYPRPLKNEEEIQNQTYLAGLGLSVIANLCLSEDVASCEELGKVCMIALGTLEHGPSRLIAWYVQQEMSLIDIASEVEIMMLKDACDCISLIGEKNRLAANALYSANCFSIFAQKLESVYEWIDCTAPSNMADCHQAYYQSLCRCINTCINRYDGPSGDVGLLLPSLARLFAIMSSRGDTVKIRDRESDHLHYHIGALECLSNALNIHNYSMGNHERIALWSTQIKFGLESLFASRIPDVQRYQALQLAFDILSIEGVIWLYSDVEDKIFELLVQTIRVEIGVLMLDAVAPDAVIEDPKSLDLSYTQIRKEASMVGGASKESNNVSISYPKSADMVDQMEALHITELQEGTRHARDRASENLPLCFMIFEYLVDGLAAIVSNDDNDIFSNHDIRRIFDSIAEIAELLLQFLEQTAGDPEVAQVDANGSMQMLLLGSLKAFCHFAAQNPHQFANRTIKLLPLLLDGRLPQDVCMDMLFPVVYGLVFSDEVNTDTLVDSLLHPSIFIPIGRFMSLNFSELESRKCQSGDTTLTEQKVKVSMLLETVVKLLRISLSTESDCFLAISDLLQVLPSPSEVVEMLDTLTSSDSKSIDSVDVEIVATCIALVSWIHMISSNQEEDLKILLKRYAQELLVTTVTDDVAPNCHDTVTSPPFQEALKSLRALCAQNSWSWGSFEVGTSQIQLKDILFMLEAARTAAISQEDVSLMQK